YEYSTCPYLSTAVACRKNGRPDSDYEKWRWKPDACSLPRFDSLDFLGKMRRKRIMLVGDSIMRNQWESLVCLVQSVIPNARKTVIYNGPTMSFLALDFEMSIEFCWAPFLVELRRGEGNKRILHLDLIEENAKYWRGVDVLVFDSAHWWTHSSTWSSWDYVMQGNKFYEHMSPMIAYQKALTKWASWIDLNLDPRRSRVFFRSMSPRHNRKWPEMLRSEDAVRTCEPPSCPGTVASPTRSAAKYGVSSMYSRYNDNVHSQKRWASFYLRPSMGEKNNDRLKDPTSDCSHWCLPGVPDAWNEILSALL
ncbi:protein trichome birefringence-like 36, partial [Dorcoceras hygrometricum]